MKQGIITKTCAVAAALAMGVSLAACGGGSSADSDKGHVYFMNNKSEVVDQYKQLAEMYTEKTGVQVDVQTGASGTYDATMSSELAKSNAPTMFNISGFDQFAKYQKYCEPLQDTEAYKLLTDDGKAYSYTIDGDSFTLPYAAEWYGIIYNKKIINDYASKDYAVIKSADDIKDYKTLKAVAESINEHKDDLGMLPYYMGIKGEEESGPAGVYDASWAVNKNASDKDKQATLDFIKWMVTDDEAKKILSQDMGFSVPFTTFDGDEFQPDNPLTKIARSYAADGKTEVRSFTVPDQQWQDDVAAALIEYAQGTGDWSKVKSAYVDGWATEWNNNEESLGSVPQAQKFDQQG